MLINRALPHIADVYIRCGEFHIWHIPVVADDTSATVEHENL